MTFTVIIPARYASTRLPAKPLVDIAGKTMIQRVYESALESDADRVIVATDDQRIVDAVNAFGGDVCLTSPDHESGTDRLQEVTSLEKMSEQDIVVNIQGDEPLVPAAVVNQVAKNLINNTHSSAATLCEPIIDIETLRDENSVKVVKNIQGNSLYFSRAPIPWSRGNYSNDSAQLEPTNNTFRHIGIYAYRVSLLNQFVRWPLSCLESIEKLEQLRILDNGHQIHVQEACEPVPAGVDTPEDLQAILKHFE